MFLIPRRRVYISVPPTASRAKAHSSPDAQSTSLKRMLDTVRRRHDRHDGHHQHHTFAVESATIELSSEVASSTTMRLGERFLLGSRMAVAVSFFLRRRVFHERIRGAGTESNRPFQHTTDPATAKQANTPACSCYGLSPSSTTEGFTAPTTTPLRHPKRVSHACSGVIPATDGKTVGVRGKQYQESRGDQRFATGMKTRPPSDQSPCWAQARPRTVQPRHVYKKRTSSNAFDGDRPRQHTSRKLSRADCGISRQGREGEGEERPFNPMPPASCGLAILNKSWIITRD